MPRLAVLMLLLAFAGACGSLPGRFPCGLEACERFAQYCILFPASGGYPAQSHCQPMDDGCAADETDDVCTCLVEERPGTPCADDGEGAVELTYIEG